MEGIKALSNETGISQRVIRVAYKEKLIGKGDKSHQTLHTFDEKIDSKPKQMQHRLPILRKS